MPKINVSNEIFCEVDNVLFFNAYKDDDVDNQLTFNLTTSPYGESVEYDEYAFDLRELEGFEETSIGFTDLIQRNKMDELCSFLSQKLRDGHINVDKSQLQVKRAADEKMEDLGFKGTQREGYQKDIPPHYRMQVVSHPAKEQPICPDHLVDVYVIDKENDEKSKVFSCVKFEDFQQLSGFLNKNELVAAHVWNVAAEKDRPDYQEKKTEFDVIFDGQGCVTVQTNNLDPEFSCRYTDPADAAETVTYLIAGEKITHAALVDDQEGSHRQVYDQQKVDDGEQIWFDEQDIKKVITKRQLDTSWDSVQDFFQHFFLYIRMADKKDDWLSC